MSRANEGRDIGDFLAAWGGISSVQLRLPVVWTEAERRGFSFQDVARWLCENPARQVNLESRKGTIAVGHDADFVIWEPQILWSTPPPFNIVTN